MNVFRLKSDSNTFALWWACGQVLLYDHKSTLCFLITYLKIYIVHQPNSETIHNQMKPKQFKRVFTIRFEMNVECHHSELNIVAHRL